MDKEYIKEFGVGIFAIAGFTRVLRKIKLNNAVKSYEKFKYATIIRWLDKRYGQEADKAIAGCSSQCKIKEDDPIWIFWWQGEETMPPVVRACYKSVLKNRAKHNVVLITQDNVKKYIDIPNHIFDLVAEGRISITHLSDVVREHILYQQGGIWMDATLYMTAPFSENIYKYEYYSLKGAFKIWPWTSFFQASGKGNVQPYIVSELFRAYLSEHDNFLTYLLLDCFISIACLKSKVARQQIEVLPVVDASVFRLNDYYLDEPYNERLFEVLKEGSNIHKLSYKYMHCEERNGGKTFWKVILEEGK